MSNLIKCNENDSGNGLYVRYLTRDNVISAGSKAVVLNLGAAEHKGAERLFRGAASFHFH